MTSPGGESLDEGPRFDAAVVRRAAAKLELRDIHLVRGNLERGDAEGLPPRAMDPSRLPDAMNMTTGAATVEEPRLLVCLVGFQTAFTEDPPPWTVAAQFRLVYEIADGTSLDADEIEQFSAHNAPFNAWPYWREFLGNMVQRAALPAMTLPVYRLLGPDRSPSET